MWWRQVAAHRFVMDPANHDVLAVLKGVRNGVVYGTKIRFPHALVMVLLFRSGTLRNKAATILAMTRRHARTLGLFVFTYKSAMLAQRRLLARDGKEAPHHAFLAGLLGGYLVFGRGPGSRSAVNQQIVLYVFVRVVVALAKLSVQPHIAVVPDPDGATSRHAWPVFASLSWALVMWLFRWHPDLLQASLRNSMVYLYRNADHWDGWRNLLWHNS